MPGKPDSPDTASYIRTLPEAECLELLAVANVGRVGFVSPTGLQIIPMNYRLGADHQLFMKTAPSSALAQLAAEPAPRPMGELWSPQCLSQRPSYIRN